MDRFMVMTIIFMSLFLPRLLFLKLFWLHRYLSSGQTCLETECVGFKPAACVNWLFCLFPPQRAALLDAMRWQTCPTTKCMQWRWSHRAGCPNHTRETRYTITNLCVSRVLHNWKSMSGLLFFSFGTLKRLHRLMSCHMLTDYERDRAAQNAVTQACGEILPLFRGPRKHLHLPRAVQSEGETSEL